MRLYYPFNFGVVADLSTLNIDVKTHTWEFKANFVLAHDWFVMMKNWWKLISESVLVFMVKNGLKNMNFIKSCMKFQASPFGVSEKPNQIFGGSPCIDGGGMLRCHLAGPVTIAYTLSILKSQSLTDWTGYTV